ncbi:serine/threonine-protein kinase [Baaleninema simplex]|uniref:serine/threonine-protein kinase n=1 Tax=Baaleninema simplex TaxID=2862350 RepID=UPI00034739C6|nr:serine/threonine-protein kinase [Baaleninema simplex]
MSHCINPYCTQPRNPGDGDFCTNCGTKLLLRDRYRVLKPIGQGGFGKTYLAVDEDLPSKPHCVVKQLHPFDRDSPIGKKMLELFDREAVSLDNLGQHPQIPTLLAHFEQDNQLYLVQEWIDGETLADELKEKGTFSEVQIRQLLENLLPVLQYVHERQAIHRDVKPQNIMRRRDSNEFVLIDFGVAKVVTETALLQTGTAIGSPEYMAPEQMRGQAFPATDIYCLGVTCLRLLTGMLPMELYDIVRGCWRWRQFLPNGVRISPQLGLVLDKAIETPLERRYRSAKAMLQDLQPLQPKPVKSHPKGKLAPPPKRSILDTLLRPVPKTPDRLISEVGVDYTELRDLLVKRKWKDSDRLTHKLLCFLVRRSTAGYLAYREIAKLPCEDLQTIDRLWVKYSNRKFGFSVQRQIYEGVDRDYPEFCDRVGWPVAKSRSPSQTFKFNLRAPVGHLPSRTWAGGLELWRHMAALSDKFAEYEENL